MQRQRLFVVAMLLILGMTFNSCMQDDRELLSEQQLSASSRSEVRDFQEHFLGVYDEDKLRAAFSGNEFTPLEFKGLRPFWDKAHVNKLGSELEVIEVPLSADELDIVFPQLLSVEELKKYQGKTYHLSLIRERNLKTQKVKEFFLCYVPNIETLEKGLPDYYHLLSLPKDFSGELLLFDLQLKPFYRYTIEGGYTKKQYKHTDRNEERLRAWLKVTDCSVLMHENGWSVVVHVTPRGSVAYDTSHYDPNKHYFTLECKDVYRWVPESLLSPADLPMLANDVPPGLPPGAFDEGTGSTPYYAYSSGSFGVEKVMPPAPVKDLAFLIKPADFNKFNEKAINTLGVEYSKMLEQHWIHKKVDEIIRSYPNLRQLNGISIEPSKVTREGAIPSAGINKAYVFNFYEAKNITARVLFHEWIHIAQFHEHKMFNKSGGIDSKMFEARRGIMEFEGWLLRDIIKFVTGKLDDTGKLDNNRYSTVNTIYSSEHWGIPIDTGAINIEQKSISGRDIDLEYEEWLKEMTTNGDSYPTAPIDNAKFRYFAEVFVKRGIYRYNGFPLDATLQYKPSLLDKIFNQRQP